MLPNGFEVINKDKQRNASFRNFTFWNQDMNVSTNSSVIKQKGKSQNGCYKKTKQAIISEKQTFLTTLVIKN